jgi:hypothetical protein
MRIQSFCLLVSGFKEITLTKGATEKKLQKQMVRSFSIFIIGLMGFCHAAFAETDVSGEDLKTLLSGNTVEGKYIKWDTTHKMYFEATGKIRRIDSKNKKEKGEWYINGSGELCISMRKEHCNYVMKRDDGGYNVYRSGTLKFTFDKIVSGNPYNL